MNRVQCLELASVIVSQDRNAKHGEPEDNFARIADLWSAYKGAEFTTTDVAMMMCLLKIARIACGHTNADSFVDLAGYAACGCELQTGGEANGS